MTNNVQEQEVKVDRYQVNAAVKAALEAVGAVFPVTEEIRAQLNAEILDNAKLPTDEQDDALIGAQINDDESFGIYAQRLGKLRVMSHVLQGLGFTAIEPQKDPIT